MKSLIVILIIAFGCREGFGQSSLSKLDWLVGNWNRTNAKPGRSGVEIWMRKSDQEFIGKGVSLRGVDTTFIEKLKIIIRDNKIYYVADVPENKEPVYFEATSLNDTSVTFENPRHDFPKKIVYEISNQKLKAVVSGNGKFSEFHFEKVQ